jgi:hypothetical protein
LCASRLRGLLALGNIHCTPARGVGLFLKQQENLMKKLITALSLLTLAGVAFAQVGTAVKETGKATAETAKQGAENAKAAVSDQPEKTVHKAKAKVHKVKAKQHRANAKEAAKETVN